MQDMPPSMYTQRIDILSLFPAMFTALEHGVTGRPACRDRLSIHTWNPRDYSLDKYQRVDDRPFGGGPGMLMSIQALADTLAAAQQAAGQEAIKPDQLAAAQTTPNAGTTSPPQTKPNPSNRAICSSLSRFLLLRWLPTQLPNFIPAYSVSLVTRQCPNSFL